ncbi:MAG: tetratricopeptide repeat protein, partial [Bacteroidetes Order II. Incertae sedis bacterium]|nr:tetratricopeptide repeat protein [Bacteroidetes Order II. bacterium]
SIEHVIEVLKVNRFLLDDGARKLGVALFTVLEDTHPVTASYRRTFDMWLY